MPANAKRVWRRKPGTERIFMIGKLIVCIVICQLAGVIGVFFNGSAISTWYPSLNKPPFNPSSWVFAPVWTTLYVMMAVALFLVIRHGMTQKNIRLAAGVFLGQLVLNALWSFFFFYLRNPLAGLVEIAILWIVLLLNIVLFYRIKPWAGGLMIPYFAWVSFAAVLNFELWRLN